MFALQRHDYASPQKMVSPRIPTDPSQLDSMIGTLQSDMTKHGISTIPKGDCAACGKTIIGQVGRRLLSLTKHLLKFNRVNEMKFKRLLIERRFVESSLYSTPLNIGGTFVFKSTTGLKIKLVQ